MVRCQKDSCKKLEKNLAVNIDSVRKHSVRLITQMNWLNVVNKDFFSARLDLRIKNSCKVSYSILVVNIFFVQSAFKVIYFFCLIKYMFKYLWKG